MNRSVRVFAPAFLVGVCGLFFATPARAAESGAANNGNAITLDYVIATTLETSLTLTLTRDRGPVSCSCAAAVSPVSVNASASVTYTPLPFLQALAGGKIGTAWNIPIADGLCLNEPSGLVHDALGGAVWMLRGGAVFQFDLAALLPGDWHHVVFRTDHELRYHAYTGARAGESWLYEGDEGENRNGWVWYGNWFLGYQTPTRIKTVGFLAEQDRNLYDEKNGSYWGDEIIRWTFGPAVSVAVTDRISTTLIAQFRTFRNYTDATEDEDYYQYRDLDNDDPVRVEFYRAALVVDYSLR